MRILLALCLLAALPAYAQVLTSPRVLGCTGATEGSSTQPWVNCPVGPGFVVPSSTTKVATGSYSSGTWRSFGALSASTLINVCPVGATLSTPTACRKANGSWGNIFVRKDSLTLPSTPPPPTVTGNMTVSWQPVTKNTDGSAATITGYRLEYGQTDFAQKITTTRTTHTLTLTPGLWQARVVALATYGESLPSASGSKTVVADTPPPVDCAVSPWSEWTGDWLPTICETGTQARTQTRSRTITTPASNGGATCPSLTESRTETQACTVATPLYRCDFSEMPAAWSCARQ